MPPLVVHEPQQYAVGFHSWQSGSHSPPACTAVLPESQYIKLNIAVSLAIERMGIPL